MMKKMMKEWFSRINSEGTKKNKWAVILMMPVACAVVIGTAYLMILPGITITLEEAEEEPGIVLEEGYEEADETVYFEEVETEFDLLATDDVYVDEMEEDLVYDIFDEEENLLADDLADGIYDEDVLEVTDDQEDSILSWEEEEWQEDDLADGIFAEENEEDMDIILVDDEAAEEELAETIVIEEMEEELAETIVIEEAEEELAETIVIGEAEDLIIEEAVETIIEEETEEEIGTIIEEETEEEIGTIIEEETEVAIGTIIEEETEEAIGTIIEEETEEAIETIIEEETEEAVETIIEEETEEAVETIIEEETEEAIEEITEEETEEAIEEITEEQTEEAIEAITEEQTEEAIEEITEEQTEEELEEETEEETEEEIEEESEEETEEETEEEIEEETEEETETYEITSRVVEVKGADYVLEVSYDKSAEIPDSAVFGAWILEDEQVQAVYEEQALEAVLAELGEERNECLQLLGMFDLTIFDRAGRAIQPKAPVTVSVAFGEDLENTEESFFAVHFPESGVSGIEELDEETGKELFPEGVQEVTDQPEIEAENEAENMEAENEAENMEAENDTENAEAEVLPAVNEDGAVTFAADGFSIYGVISAGTAVDLDGKTFAMINSYSNNAMQAEKLNDKKLEAELVTFEHTNDGDYIFANDDITFWTFHAAGNGTYTIQSQDGRWLHIDGNNNDGTVAASTKPQALTVTAGTGSREGMIRITNASGIAINNYNGSTAGGFGTYNDKGNNEWFTLYEAETIILNPAYAAEKISVQDLEDAQRVILYKTVYNEKTERYEDYVIDGNGSLIRAYDKGNQVVGRSGVSTVWTVIMHRDAATGELNGYYDFYNEETGLYLCPRSDGTLVSAAQQGVTLNGRRDGTYNSTVEAWDTSAWAWYGYQIGTREDGRIVLESGTGSASQEFSFAAYISETKDELVTVPTVDSAAAGITIHMFNYPSRATISDVTGSDGYAVNVLPGQHASMVLTDGYPTFGNGARSGSKLFSTDSKYYQGTGNHLFLESIYNATGYYKYSAFNNFAHYNAADGNFSVYEATGTPSNGDMFYFKRGNFFPYNNLDVTRKATNRNRYDGSANPLSPLDPTLDGTLYMINDPDFYFGMTMEATFMQPKDGMDQNGPVVYDFNGDDDLWIYIDDVLILDIGGVHDAWQGSINFADGTIYGRGAGGATNIRDCFRNAGLFPDGTAWDDARADEYFKGNTFADYGSHSFKMFYMEHGAGASNLEMSFNLPVIEKGRFTVEKVLEGTSQQAFANVSFAYQAFKKDDNGDDVALTEAVYEGTDTHVTFYDEVEINGKTYTNVFYLKPGEAATFAEMADDELYYVREIGIGSDYYEQVVVNDVTIDGQEATATDGVYPTTVAAVGNRARVTFANRCSQKNLNDLRITKRITEDSMDDGSTFEFRVLLENADGVLAPYSGREYYIQNDEGEYFRYVNGQLTGNGMTPIVASVSGNNGTIAGVPAGYTVVIRDLLADTDFYVEEIRVRPAGADKDVTLEESGWSLEEKAVAEGSCGASSMTGTGWTGNGITADGQIVLDKDAQITFTNARDFQYVSVWKTDLGHEALTGASFALYTAEAYDENGTDAEPVLVTTAVDDNGLLPLGKLAVGTYRLVEMEAPEGYERAASAITIIVDRDEVTGVQSSNPAEVARKDKGEYSRYWVSGQDDLTWQVRVWNNPGVALPATGGAGTGIFTLLGWTLILGAGILLVVRRRAM